MKVKILFILPISLFEASMTLGKAVLLTRSPGVKKASEAAVLSSPRSRGNVSYSERLLIWHHCESDGISTLAGLTRTQVRYNSGLAHGVQRDIFFPTN